MNWKNKLTTYEKNKEWDLAIHLMQQIIKENPENMDAYIAINYLLMNLLVEEDYDTGKHDYYAHVLKQYFDESYKKFHENAEYLFFTAITAFMSEWYFDITLDDARAMIKKANALDPENILYKWGYYTYLDMSDKKNEEKALPFAALILKENLPIQQQLKSKGALGEYVLEIMKNSYESNK